MDVSVRRATIVDLASISRLSASVHNVHSSTLPERFKPATPDGLLPWFVARLDDPDALLWVAAVGETVAGYLLAAVHNQSESEFGYARRRCFLDQLAVEESYQCHGVARALVASLVDEAIALGAGEIELNTWLFNRDAYEAFCRLGFEPARVLFSRRVPGVG